LDPLRIRDVARHIISGVGVRYTFAVQIFPLFRIYELRRISRLHQQLLYMLAAWSITLCVLLGFLYATRTAHELSRLWIAYWFLIAALGLAGIRLLLQHPAARNQVNRLSSQLAIVGGADEVDSCIERLSAETDTGSVQINLVSRLSPMLPISSAELDLLEERLIAREVEHVVLASADLEGVVKPVLQRLRHLPVELTWAPKTFDRAIPILSITALVQ
jgi:FlaA1/EpsC-like NDP-sugar epimerase